MNAKERGFLLLTSQLGDLESRPLTVAQFRTLAGRMAQMDRPLSDRQLLPEDLIPLGYSRIEAERIVALLARDEILERYISRGRRRDCVPVSRISDVYPLVLRKRLGLDAPGCLWAKGELSLLDTKTIALVGSRELSGPNRLFAERAGYEAARQGITLVSGNARGADRTAQEACLKNGGKVISVVADELEKCPLQENVLYLSEDSFDLPFSSQRALSRNRVIHGLGYLTLVAQCDLGVGGTWDGTARNLNKSWSPVFCFADGSAAVAELEQMGATPITIDRLADLKALQSDIAQLTII